MKLRRERHPRKMINVCGSSERAYNLYMCAKSGVFIVRDSAEKCTRHLHTDVCCVTVIYAPRPDVSGVHMPTNQPDPSQVLFCALNWKRIYGVDARARGRFQVAEYAYTYTQVAGG